jgi:hypothetical protein
MTEPRLFCLAQWTECDPKPHGNGGTLSVGLYGYLVYGEEAEVEAGMLLLHEDEPVTP